MRLALQAAVLGLAVVGIAGAAGSAGREGGARMAARPDAAPRTESLDAPRGLMVLRYKPRVLLGFTYDGAMTTGFEVERAIVAGSARPRPEQFTRIGTPGREARSFRDPTSRPGMTYVYRMRAVGPGTVSLYSKELIVRINTSRRE